MASVDVVDRTSTRRVGSSNRSVSAEKSSCWREGGAVEPQQFDAVLATLSLDAQPCATGADAGTVEVVGVSSRLRIFPVAVIGRLSTNSTTRGYL